MKQEKLKAIEQLSQFFDGTQAVIFKIATVKKEQYDWLRHELVRLSTISVSHLYNLRKSTTYCRTRQYFEKTKPIRAVIGERRKPKPEGQPGFIWIDTVHQGDLDKKKSVYHINAVDEETQFEVVATVEKSVNIF